MMIFKIKNKLLLSMGIFMLILVSSCTKFPENLPVFEEYREEVDTTVKRKVLVIAIDGLVGSQIKAYKPTNISKMMEHAKYSYESKADDNTNPYASWTTLLTGYKSNNHKVTSESFMVDINLDREHADYELNKSILYRLERANSKLRTVTVVQNPTMNAKLLSDADSNNVVNSDDQAAKQLINFLKAEKTDFVIGQFTGLLAAGKDGGFKIANANYRSALDQVDKYIGDVMAALEARETYAKEKWLVVICSPHGGTGKGAIGGSTADEVNTFCLFYNKSFKPLEIRGESMSFMHANGYALGTYQPFDDTLGNKIRIVSTEGVRAQSPAGTVSNVFNPSTYASKAITFEFKMNILSEGIWRNSDDYRNTTFMGKDLDDMVHTKGWSFYTGANGENMLLFQNGVVSTQVSFVRKRNKWCHYAFVFKQVSTIKTSVEIYEDGELIANSVIDMGLSDFENQDPLTIGYTTNTKLYSIPNYYISNFRVWNKGLSQAEVKETGCKNAVESTDALYGNLVAYYKSFNDDKKWLNDANTTAPNLTMTGAATNKISQFYSLCAVDPSAIYSQTVDLLPQIFYWFDLDLSGDDKLEGREFLDTFLDEFWRD